MPLRPSPAALLTLVAACCVATSGCQVGRRWFQFDSDSRIPGVGVELRAESKQRKADTKQVRQSPQESSGVRTAEHEHDADTPRKRLPDWLRLGGREERVPLPLTANAEPVERPAASSGPVEEFH
jgi:hypothetical protein